MLKHDTAFPRDAEFLDYIRSFVDESRLSRAAVDRLFDLARRGAAVENLGQVGQLSEELERVKREAERAQDAHGVRFLNYLEETARLTDEVERLRAALREIAKVTRGWEPGVWTEEEGRQYFAALFFGAQKVARAALEGKSDV